MVVLTTGGLAHEAIYSYEHLTSLLSHKWGDEYSVVMGWLQCWFVIFFNMFCYSMCLWGLVLNLTPHCGSSTNGFSEGGVQYDFGR